MEVAIDYIGMSVMLLLIVSEGEMRDGDGILIEFWWLNRLFSRHIKSRKASGKKSEHMQIVRNM